MSTSNSLRNHHIKADKIVLLINIILVLFAFVLAAWYDTWTEAMIIGPATGLTVIAVYLLAPGSVVSRMTMGAALMITTGLHIHQTHGMVEFHFGVFAWMAVLLYYRDWIPLVTAASVITLHHVIFIYLQTQGSSIWVFSSTEDALFRFFLHAGYLIMETAILLWFSIDLKKDALQSTEIMNLTDHMIDGENINLTLQSTGSTSLLGRFDDFTGQLRGVAHQVNDAATELNQEGQGLADITVRMRDGSKLQQQETDMVAAAIEEMSCAINEVAKSAETAVESSNLIDQSASKATEYGGKTQDSINLLAKQVNQAEQTIGELDDQSQEITQVLEVIRSIAEQTNLLALNAAIEAARAGEQGTGFAVVAEEVRVLAQRTQKSTEEIDRMIVNLQSGSASAVKDIKVSKQFVDSCVEHTEGSLSLMQQVEKSLGQINQMNSTIAAATTQQGHVITEISSNISNILSASNRAAKDAELASSAGKQLLQLADDLSNTACRFKT